MDWNNEKNNSPSDLPPQEIVESRERLSSRAAGALLVLSGAAAALLLYFDGQIARLPVLAQVVYWVPSVFLAALGIGCLRGSPAAYETAKVVFTSSVTMFAALAAAFALLAVLAASPFGPIPDIPVVNIGFFAIIAGMIASAIGRARPAVPAEKSGFVAKQPVMFSTELFTGVCFFLLFDAMSAGNVGALVENFVEEVRSEMAFRAASRAPTPAPAASAPPQAVQAPPPDLSHPPSAPQSVFQSFGLGIAITRTGEAFLPDFTNRRSGTSIAQFWHPQTGALRTVTLPVSILPGPVVAMPQGLLVGNAPRDPSVSDGTVVLITPENTAITAKLNVPRTNPAMLALSDTQVLVAGGVVSWGPGQGYSPRAVELVTIREGGLSVEKLPDLPGAASTGYALVALADGRAMMLGGTASPDLGCGQCTADTYLLDAKTRTWRAGPKMTEPRANASATLLPDGSVLVVGGWTPAAEVGKGGPGRTTERWDPHSNTFSAGALLPAGEASLRPLWAPGQEGKLLLLAGGRSGFVQVYDVARKTFRLAGEWWMEQDKVGLIPLVYRGDTYLWLIGGALAFPEKLRLPSVAGSPVASPAADFDHKFYRAGLAFVPARGDAPALALGGAFSGMAPGYEENTGAADAIWPDGRVESLAPLNRARSGARAFRLPDGSVLVAGGEPPGRDQPAPMHLEWMPAARELAQASWVTLDATLPGDVALGQLGDGSVVSVDTAGNVQRLGVSRAAQGEPVLRTEALPPAGAHGHHFQVKGLADGRIILTGGAQPPQYIALLPADPSDPNAPDKYVPLDEGLPADTYRIYDPHQKTWHNSAPFDYGSGQVAILDDGRVVSYREDGMKISNAAGTSWSDLPETQRAECLDSHNSRMFTLEGELFLSGCDNDNIRIVQWFDFAAMHWTTIWEVPPIDVAERVVHQANGRIIGRLLQDGMRVELPIQGP